MDNTIRNYRPSIKCKYCKFYHDKTRRCFLCTSYDRLLDKDNTPDKCFMMTEPDSHCSSFALSSMEVIAASQVSSQPATRADGSYIVNIPEDMKAALQEKSQPNYTGCTIFMYASIVVLFIVFGLFLSSILS